MNSEKTLRNESLLITQKELPKEPLYLRNLSIAQNYSIVLCVIIVICAIASLITNIIRKSKIRIIVSIVLVIIASIITKLLQIVALNYAMSGYETNIGSYNFIGIGTLITIAITLLIMIFKKNK